MKKIWSIPFAFVMAILLTVTSFAASSLVNINSITYTKNSDGSAGEKYTGWTKASDSGELLYYVDGIRATGVVAMDNGDRCYFKDNGVFLNKRNSENGFNIVFDNNYTVKLSDGKIAFHVVIDDLKGKNPWDFGSSPYFDLYVLKNDKWVHIPYAYDEFLLYEVTLADDNLMHFSKELKDFDYKFEPGIYRVKVTIGSGKFDENGNAILQIVRSEFNIK